MKKFYPTDVKEISSHVLQFEGRHAKDAPLTIVLVIIHDGKFYLDGEETLMDTQGKSIVYQSTLR